MEYVCINWVRTYSKNNFCSNKTTDYRGLLRSHREHRGDREHGDANFHFSPKKFVICHLSLAFSSYLCGSNQAAIIIEEILPALSFLQ
jgi:hypothetical protein